MKKSGFLLALLLFGMLAPVGTWYGPTINVGPGTDKTYCLELADLDKDGNTDIIVGNYGEQNVIYFGDGDGTFDTTSHNFGTGIDLTEIIVAYDVNSDTWDDLVVGNNQQWNVIYINDGDGTFDTTSYNFGTGTDYTFGLALGDTNGDTLPDLAVGNNGQQNYVYIHDGTGNPYDTVAPIPFGLPGPDFDDTWDVVLATMNGDTVLDLVVANHQQSNYVYIGDGDGTFDTTSFSFGVGTDFIHSVAVGYLDGDAVLDVVEGNDNGQNKAYLGNGDGSLTQSHNFGITGHDKTQAVVLVDVNSDTILDVVAANGDDVSQLNQVFLGNGDGTFGGAKAFGSGDTSWDAKCEDFDGDTLIDVVVGNVGQNCVYLNMDTAFENIGGLFDTNTFFVAGDNAYCTDVLGSAKIAFGLAAGGASENPEGRTDVILTATEHDTGNLIPVGGPAINPVADEFDIIFGITYQYVENNYFQINAEGYSLYLNLQNYPERDICIVYLAEHNNRNIMLVWGYGWQGTYAGSAFIGDPNNWTLYQDYHMLMIRWIDSNADGLVQMGEITVEQAA